MSVRPLVLVIFELRREHAGADERKPLTAVCTILLYVWASDYVPRSHTVQALQEGLNASLKVKLPCQPSRPRVFRSKHNKFTDR